MEEFDQLIAQICNSQSTVDIRSYAERRLLDILSEKSSWRVYSNLLPQANDTVCFFICIGLQRLVWKHWKEFSSDDKNQLNQIVVQSLSTKKNMQHFAKSKLEQMLATICANSCSLEPVLSLLVPADQPGALVGLSAMRSVLDLVLSDDPKLIPEHKATVLTVIHEILTPMTNLACSACSVALQTPTEDNLKLMSVSLELLKITIGKLQIGPHISRDVINLLFTLAELGADDSSVLHKAAMSSIEVLTEIMGKRYIPPSHLPSSVSPSSAAMHASTFVPQRPSGSDSSSDMLLDIMGKSVSLLKKYRSHNSIEDSPVVLSLLEFISVFAESHLERCINMTANGGSSNVLLTQSIGLFFEELVAVTTVSMEPRILSKVVSVWNRVISLEAVKNMLLNESNNVCLSIVSHLLQSCLTQTSTHLSESTEELIEDLRVDGVADPHMKEILAHLVTSEGAAPGAGKGDEVLSAEESSFVGTALLHDVNMLFAELVSSSGVAQWLNQTTSQLLTQNIALLSNGSTQPTAKTCAALDICFIVRLLPMITSNKNELILQLTDLAVRLMEARMHSYGKELLVLEISCCHIAGQIMQSGYLAASAATQGLTQELRATMTSLFSVLLRGLAAVSDVYISPSPGAIIVAVCVLLNQAIAAFSDLLDAEAAINSTSSVKGSVFQALNTLLDKSKDLSVEAYALLICAHDHLDPNSVASSLVAQCMECVALLESNCSKNVANSKAQIGAVIRVCGAMDSLSRHHSLSKAPRRQCLVAHFTPLQSVLGNFISVIFRQIIQSYSTQTSSSASSTGSSIQAATIVVSLAGGLLQSLGKKTFGKVASDVLSVCVDFAENVRNTPLTVGGTTNSLSTLLFDGSGLLLTKQFLELSRVLAESTGASSSTASPQALVTHRLLAFVTTGLSDERVCAELLQPTLKAGVVAIGCYWQKAQKPMFSPLLQNSLQASITSSAVDGGEASGTNVQAIAVLLTQLCVGSLGPSVPPQDTLTALEGLISLSEQHQLFAAAWFQSQSWGSLLTPCLRAVLLRIHNMHRDTIETLLVALAKAGLSSYLSAGASPGNESPGQNNQQLARAQEFWLNIGREVVTVASEFNCGEVANQTVYSVVTAFTNNGSKNAQGPGSLDMRLFVDRVLSPVSAEIARLL